MWLWGTYGNGATALILGNFLRLYGNVLRSDEMKTGHLGVGRNPTLASDQRECTGYVKL